MNNLIDKPTCNCGIIGVFGHPDASLISYYGLHALQHRGQEAAGILTSDQNSNFNIHKGMGLVSEVFSDPKVLTDDLVGNSAIGHNRYSTTGASDSRKNIQPFFVNYRLGMLAIAHNGNLTNAKSLRTKLVDEGAIFQTTSDTEVILHLIARSRKTDQIEQVKDALSQIQGAFSLVILTDSKLIAARDKFGIRPLSIGKLGGAYIVSSETCALDINSATFIRDIAPGEILVLSNEDLNNQKISSYSLFDEPNSVFPKKHCVFEYIYFSRPDSQVFGSNVDKMRRKLGKILALRHPVNDKDDEKVIVISVPDSSNTTAIGYNSGLHKLNINSKLEIGLIRSHYIGRTFIAPTQHNREIGVKIKFNIVKGVLENKTVVVVDDSIVRGTTSKQLIKLLKEAKPKEIHLRISSPMITHPCFYGMNFPSKEELIANKFNSDIVEVKKYLEVDSLEYLSIEDMLSAMTDHDKNDFCTACFSGSYPIPINE
ncbi:MAG: glutamine phosphoribosylpyrophosphate amidotransferase [Ignavibacteria bacterium]|nr:MAG: glutamine phosphoribosylpyrophosphate amidotransferase [Ignavibacteria bacterium]KAF0162080.1 MAG: glutamine phosphoribosylpyrophosphate amidotransferase [Ignavibacteria bacterium]